MEHEVFVPVPVQSLRAVLADPARVARCVPGLQQDADASAGPLSGRLKVRAGGHTVTYRGALHLAAREDGGYDVSGEGAEARGSGGVKVALTARLTPADGGTDLAFTGTASAEGRLAELPADTLTTTAHRLLDRFGEALAEEAAATPAARTPAAATVGDGNADEDGDAAEATADDAVTDVDAAGDDVPAAPDATVAETVRTDGAVPADADAEAEAADLDNVDLEVDDVEDADGAEDDGVDDGAVGAGGDLRGGVFDAPVPPSSLDPFAVDDFPVDDTEPPAEAAHARRTMIGRSAEEVDHAPPRGRYAPVPGPAAGSGAGMLRWLAPAAALALASAVLIGRALRRRK
ncbi:SRPBCC domain-containing protein [Streptomyces thermolilacinus]|uniref:Carbon monoxide dehydrogenase n=1 Tax=Streptomyces thermolilacinus SPC6 TaxID=1306406 RepID=A0A1D3DTH8_9ACTN|nr:SRPBCC domain-containing protein [Streptomyces thermolilacinus]OEJ95599.1 carbon monoxide dehydrogenase [Streptomyces thermolilacinus SPC6]